MYTHQKHVPIHIHKHTHSKYHADKASVLTPPQPNKICSVWLLNWSTLFSVSSKIFLSKITTIQAVQFCWRLQYIFYLSCLHLQLVLNILCPQNITGLSVSFLPLSLPHFSSHSPRRATLKAEAPLKSFLFLIHASEMSHWASQPIGWLKCLVMIIFSNCLVTTRKKKILHHISTSLIITAPE